MCEDRRDVAYSTNSIKLLITTYQEVDKIFRKKNTCCDDEIVRIVEKSTVCQSNIF